VVVDLHGILALEVFGDRVANLNFAVYYDHIMKILVQQCQDLFM
jgi:hypothetical protein